jgi:hypothetical protein
MSTKNKAMIQGLDEENLKRAQKMYDEAQEGSIMTPKSEVDFDQEGFVDGATWALELVMTVSSLIRKQVRDQGLPEEVAVEAITGNLHDALVSCVTGGALITAYQKKGETLPQLAAQRAVDRAEQAVSGEGNAFPDDLPNVS